MKSSLTLRRPQRGATLLEAIAFLGIAAFVILGAVSLFDKAMTDSNVNAAIVDIQSVVQSIRKAYAGQSNFSGLNTDMLDQLGATPKNWSKQTTGGTYPNKKSQFGGQVVLGTTDDSSVGDSFYIAYTNVPKGACTSLVQALAQQSTGVIVASKGTVNIGTAPNGTSGSPYASGFNKTTLPAVIASTAVVNGAASGCGGTAPFSINARFGFSGPSY